MTTKSTRAILAAGLLAACASAALLAPANAAPSLSSSVQSALTDAQKAAAKKDYAAAATAVALAKTNAKTDYDNYMVNRMTIAVAFQNNDIPGAAAAAQAVSDSPIQEEKEKVSNLTTAMELEMLAKQYDVALKDAKALAPSNPPDPKVMAALNQAYYFGGDFADAKTLAQKRIDDAKAAGKVPARDALEVLQSSYVGLKDEAGAETALEQQVVAYNDPNDWAELIDVAITSNGIRDVEAVWLGRLLFLLGGNVTKDDANMVGAIASHLTFFGDAVNAKAHGGTVDPDPAPRADADKKTIAAQIAAEGAQNGTYSAKLAEALYSYGMYPEAEAAATTAMTKGGNPDTTEAPMVLGQALAAQGKYDDALAAFGKVTGGGPATARITRLWVAYVNTKKNPPVAAAPAQAAAK